MSNEFWVALFAFLGVVVGVVGPGIVLFFTTRASESSRRQALKVAKKAKKAIAAWSSGNTENHLAMNSRLDLLLETFGGKRNAEGKLEGRAEMKAETDAAIAAEVFPVRINPDSLGVTGAAGPGPCPSGATAETGGSGE